MTPHQHRLTKMRLSGMSYGQIAHQRRVSVSAVQKTFQLIYRQLGIEHTRQLGVAYYLFLERSTVGTSTLITENKALKVFDSRSGPC